MKTKNKEKEWFLQGMETALDWIRKDVGGSAGRIVELHAWKIQEYIKQARIYLKKK